MGTGSGQLTESVLLPLSDVFSRLTFGVQCSVFSSGGICRCVRDRVLQYILRGGSEQAVIWLLPCQPDYSFDQANLQGR